MSTSDRPTVLAIFGFEAVVRYVGTLFGRVRRGLRFYFYLYFSFKIFGSVQCPT